MHKLCFHFVWVFYYYKKSPSSFFPYVKKKGVEGFTSCTTIYITLKIKPVYLESVFTVVCLFGFKGNL